MSEPVITYEGRRVELLLAGADPLSEWQAVRFLDRGPRTYAIARRSELVYDGGPPQTQNTAPVGTLATIGNPANGRLIIRSGKGWVSVHDLSPIDPEDFRAGWEIVTSAGCAYVEEGP